MRPALTEGRTPRITRDCVECGLRWIAQTPMFVNVCKECRESAVAPTIDLLGAMEPCCREAYVRGILAEKVRSHDREAIMAIGAILDSMRVSA